jgi:hypothetical protein
MLRAKRLDLPPKSRKQFMKGWLIRPAASEIEHLPRVAQQNAARARHPGCTKKIEDWHVQAAVKSSECDYQAAWVFTFFDYEIGAAAWQ